MSAAASTIRWSAATAASFERQWEQLRQSPATTIRGGEVAEAAPGGRSSTLNLIVRAAHAADAELMAGSIWELGPRHPARVFLVVPPEGADTAARLRVAAQPNGAELLELAAGPERAASLVSPLLQSDLPTVLLWRGGSPLGNPEFALWASVADRVLVDAYQLGLNLEQLAALAAELPERTRLTDLTWTRLTPWRQLLCQGLEVHPGSTGSIARVRFGLGHVAPAPSSSPVSGGAKPAAHAEQRQGELAATLLAGWLAQQLGWVDPQRLGAGRLRLTRSRSPEQAPAVEFEFESSSTPAPTERGRLLRHVKVEIAPAIRDEIEHHGSHLSLSVHDGEKLLGRWAGATVSSRRTDPGLLCEELSIYGSDPLFLQALERGREMLACLRSAAA